MKLNKEMIDAMGGADSDQYRRFRTLACEAYNILRKWAPATDCAVIDSASFSSDILAAHECTAKSNEGTSENHDCI